MSEEFVGIRVGIEGDERALESLKKLQDYVKALKNTKINVRTNVKDVNKLLTALRNVNKEISRTNSRSVTPKGNQQGVNRVLNAVRTVGKEITKVNGRTINPKARFSQFRQVEGQIRRLDGSITRINGRVISPKLNTAQVERGRASVQNLDRETRNVDGRTINIKVNSNGILEAGRALQNFGGAMMNIANNPFTNAFRQIGTSLIAQSTGLITQGLQKTVSRFDTMRVFPKMMQSMGFSAEDSQKAINELDQSVRGLPTALNEITDAANQYALTTGSIEKGTQYAIAANRAFLASASSEAQQYQGRLQLNDLFSGKKLNSREWMSLAASMPAAIREIGKVLGYKDTGKFRQMLFANQIATEDFTKALVEVGTKGGKIYEMAEISKTTLSGLISNTKIAISRLGEGVLAGIDDAFKKNTGKSMVQNLRETLIPAVDSLTNKFKAWAKANPEKITGFFDALKNFDWAGLGKGMMAAGKAYAGLIQMFSKMPKGILGFVLAGGTAPFGKLLAGIGSILISYGKLQKAMGASGQGKIGGFFSKLFGGAKGAEKTAAEAATTAAATSKTSASMKQIATGFLRAVRPAGIILAYTGTFYAVAKALKEIGSMHIDLGQASKNIGKIAVAMAEMMGTIGAFATVGTLGRNMFASLGRVKTITTGIMAIADAGVFLAVGKIMEQINKIDIGGWGDIHGKIAKIGAAIAEMKVISTVLGALTALQFGTIFGGVAEALGDLAAIMTSETWLMVTESLSKISKLKIPEKGKIKNVAESLVELKKEIVSDEVLKELKDLDKIYDAKSALKGLEEATGHLADALTNVSGLKTNLEKLGKKAIKEETIDTAIENITTLTGSFGSLYTAIENMAKGDEEAGISDSFWSPGSNSLSEKIKRYADSLTNMSEALGQVSAIGDKLVAIKEKFKELQKSFGTEKDIHGNPSGKGLNTTAITTTIQTFTSLIDEIVTGENGLGSLQQATKQLENVNVDTISTQLDKIPQLMTSLNAVKASLSSQKWLMPENAAVDSGKKNKFGLFDTSVSGAGAFTTSKPGRSAEAGGLLTGIQGLVQVVSDIAIELAKVESLDLEGKAVTLQKAITAVKKAVGMMSQLKTATAKDSEDKTDIATAISDMITNLSNALKGSDALMLQVTVFNTAIAGLKSALNALAMEGGASITSFTTVLGTIPGAITTVSNAVKGKGAEWKEQIAGGFEGTAGQVKAEMDAVAEALNRDFSGYGSSAGTRFVNAFNAAFAHIRTSVAAPTVTGGMSWRVRKGGSDRMQTNGSFGHTGGLIGAAKILYRRAGGAIGFPGSPKGIDRIPVWAAEGEFMMNRRATRALGPKVLQQFNHGNWDAAFAELSGRMSRSANVPGKVTVDRSKHTNIYNNQQVTQNINRADQEFSELRMNRYLRRM